MMDLEEAKFRVWSELPEMYDSRIVDCLKVLDLQVQPGDRVLDLGCGIGRLTLPLAWRHPDSQFIGYDTDPHMLELAPPAPNVIWQLGGPLPEVDLAFSIVTFQHISPEGVFAYLKEIARCCLGNFRFQFVEGTQHAEYHHQYTMVEMLHMVDDAGLHIRMIEKGLLYPEWTWMTVCA